MLLALSTTGLPDGGHGLLVPRAELERIHGFDPLDEVWLTTSELNQTDKDHPYFDGAEYRGTFTTEWIKNDVFPLIRGEVELAAEKSKKGG